MRNKTKGEAIEIIYSGEDATKMRSMWLYEWNKYDEGNHIPKQQVEDITRIRYYVKEISVLCNEIIYNKEIYNNNQIIYRIENLLKDAQEDLRIEGSRRNVFILLTLVILDIPDEIICHNKKQPSIAVILESILLQYFYVGEEQKQEIKISYDDLYDIFGIKR